MPPGAARQRSAAAGRPAPPGGLRNLLLRYNALVDALLNAFAVLLPLLYLVVALDYGFLFFTAHPSSRRIAAPTLRVALVVHAAYIVTMVARYGQLPAVNVSQALSVVAFAVAIVYAIVEWHGRESSTGFWLTALVFVFQLLASLLQRPPENRELFHDPLFATHVALALLGYAAFAVAAAYGFLFLVLYRELKGSRFSIFYGKLPPLEVLERMLVGALAVGVAALTGAVIAGGFWAQRLYHGQWLRDPKILATIVTWAIYVAALGLRRLRRWQGLQTAIASLAGLAAILFSLFAVNLLFTHFHDFQ